MDIELWILKQKSAFILKLPCRRDILGNMIYSDVEYYFDSEGNEVGYTALGRVTFISRQWAWEIICKYVVFPLVEGLKFPMEDKYVESY